MMTLLLDGMLSLLLTGLGFGPLASQMGPQKTKNDTVTITAGSCASGCSSEPTVTATSKGTNDSNDGCNSDCCLVTSSSTVTFDFTSADGVTFMDKDCTNAITTTTGTQATYWVQWENDEGGTTCSDPTITVQTGKCGGDVD
ncbi:MAG: hypothetical protein AB1Z98_36680 [Nannocystaceae bacterium]